ncbi:MAG TPA: glycosyltransferase family 2 protein [Polyangiaceae bacterium]|nr:glycosyltransferase family 2 protein [Polyangiaceae bacterium]
MQRAYLIPAYQAGRSLKLVIDGLRAHDPEAMLLVVDDGSTDGTADVARAAAVNLVSHARNRGKGVALRTGLKWLFERGFASAVSVDADGQHRAEDAVALARHPAPETSLLLGVRDLARDGAPGPSRFSNRFSNWWVSLLSGQRLSDTQCGLRRYPLRETLQLESNARGYGFESEMLVRAVRRSIPIVEVPVRVIYPPRAERVSHFHVVRDPARIVLRLLHTALTVRRAS